MGPTQEENMISYAVSMACCGKVMTRELANAFRKSKLRNVEITLAVYTQENEISRESEKLTLELIGEGTIHPASVHLPFCGIWDPSELNEEKRKYNIACFSRLIQEHSGLLGEHMTLHASAEPPLAEHPARIDQVCRSLEDLMPLAEARRRRLRLDFAPVRPVALGITDLNITVGMAAEYINWKPFFKAWQLMGDSAADEAERLKQEALEVVERLKREADDSIRARIGLWQAFSNDDNIVIAEKTIIPVLRQQHTDGGGDCTLSLADFVAPENDYIGTFAVTSGNTIEQIIERYRDDGDDYHALLLRTVADRLAEAATELMHRLVAKKYWGYYNDGTCPGIRPAIGYPSLPDQSLIFNIDRLMPLAPVGIHLTENGAMSPASGTCGLIIAHPQSRYFMVGAIGDDQRNDYAARRGMNIEDLRKWLR